MAKGHLTSITIYGNDSLEGLERRINKYLHEKYHSHPTKLDFDYVFSEDEKAEIASRMAEGQAAADRLSGDWDGGMPRSSHKR